MTDDTREALFDALPRMGSRDGVVLAADDPRHGSSSTYSNWRCRCDACRAAWRVRHREYMLRSGRTKETRAQFVARVTAAADARDNHGTETRYKRGCRCAVCVRGANEARYGRREANPLATRAYERAYRGYAPLRAIDDSSEALIRRAEALTAARESAAGELAELVSEQEKDERRVWIQPGWVVSLDSRRWDDGETWHDSLALGGRHLRGYETDSWTDAVCAVVDHRREIDAWAEAA